LRGYVAAEGEFENDGREPRGPRERAQKIFENFFKKKGFLGVYGAGEGKLKNDGRQPRGPRKRAQKIFGQLFWKEKCFLRCYVAGEGELENDGREPLGCVENISKSREWLSKMMKEIR